METEEVTIVGEWSLIESKYYYYYVIGCSHKGSVILLSRWGFPISIQATGKEVRDDHSYVWFALYCTSTSTVQVN